MLITFYIFVILFLLYLLFNRVFTKVFRPYSMGQLKKSKEDRIYSTNSDFTLDDLSNSAAKRLPLITMSEDFEIDLSKKINRLGLDTTAKQIRKLQLLYFVSTLVIAVIGKIIFGEVIAFIIAVMSLYTWRYPIIYIEQQIHARDEAIKRELPELYAVLYYAYIRSPSINLTSKVQSYIKDSSDLFYKEMMIFIEDAKSGEIIALREFKKRVPIAVVSRFCDIMENRLVGTDNVGVMTSFKDEMDQKRREREDKLLKDLTNKLNKISWVGIMIPMTIILIIYFAAQMMSAFVN